MLIKEIPLEERPRERLSKLGKENLSNEELLAILLKSGTRDKSSKTLALELLSEVGGINNLKEATLSSLTKIKGLGRVKAIELLATIELGKRIFLAPKVPLEKLENPYTIWDKTKYLFADSKQEKFYGIYFNAQQEVVSIKLLFVGTLDQSLLHPREIFKEAYLQSASSIICLHNHPSNNVTPSEEDIKATKSLAELGKLNAIPVVDHIIVGSSRYYSFYEEGLL